MPILGLKTETFVVICILNLSKWLETKIFKNNVQYILLWVILVKILKK